MKLLKPFALSAAMHGLCFGLVWGIFAWRDAQAANTIGIDLAGSSLLLRPANATARARPAAPPEPWLLSLNGAAAAPSKAVPQPLSTTVEPEGPACPPPCPETPGDWMPAAEASRQPSWVDGNITEDDYPPSLRSAGKEGLVIVNILVDAVGDVKGVELVQGSDAAFNDLVVSRLKASRFRPAYDQNGNARACRFQIPIRFQLH